MQNTTQTQKQNQSIWSQFTKQYSLSKTLRFELKPVSKTADFLKENKIFEKDQTIDESYNQAKFYFDKLHQKLINEALTDKKEIRKLNFKDFVLKLNQLRQEINQLKNQKAAAENKNDKDEIQNKINSIENKIAGERENLYGKIKAILDDKAEEWKKDYQTKTDNEGKKIKFSKTDLEQKGTDFLMASGVLEILKYEYSKEKEEEFRKKDYPSLFIEDKANPGKKVYIFEKFDDFTTYLTKFQETRKNLYKDDGTSTAVATRIVSNFEIFLKNKAVFDEKYKDWKKIGLTDEQVSIFEIDYYYQCLIQEGIDKYNKIIGEINAISKKYRDQNKINKKDLPLFKTLDKQILGEVKKERELITKTEKETEEEVFIKRFQEFVSDNKQRISKAKELINELFNGKFEEDYDGIYFKRVAINTIAYKWFEDPVQFLNVLPQAGSSKKTAPKVKPFVSLLDIKNAIEGLSGNIFKSKYYKDSLDSECVILDKDSQESKWQQFLKIWQHEFEDLFKDKFDNNNKQIFWGYTDKLEKEAENLSSFKRGNKENIALVKNYSDAALRIHQMMRYFALETKNEKDVPTDYNTEFYARFDEYYKDFQFRRYYDAIRNFVTKKPSNEDKIKLNFESGSLLSGFDRNKESEKLGVILRLRNNNKYFVGIINKKFNKIFDEKKHPEFKGSENDTYEKMELKLFPDPKKMIPKIAFAAKNVKQFGLTDEILKIKKEYEEFQKLKKKDKNAKFDKNKLSKLIGYYQRCLENSGYKDEFGFQWKKPEEYNFLSEFNSDTEKNNYKIKFIPVSDSYIKQKIENGELYLFEVSNKDFVWSEQKKNIHTLYFLNLFSEGNLKNPIFRLAANAEVFYRPAQFKPEEDKERTEKLHKKIVKYKRYTEDKILFHLPIEINYGAPKAPNEANRKKAFAASFNKNLNDFIVKNKDNINIIGIDRGEKNLLYYCVIDRDENILDYDSFNEIEIKGKNNEIKKVNYFEKLLKRERDRLRERKSWEPVSQIKDLKKGYLSYVIKKIADLAVEYNAVIVLEDLNFRFKQIRGGIERSIYQQFEKTLIDKLGYLVFKDKHVQEVGGVLNGYQLVAPFTSFQNIGKQTGIIFYTDAEYTSKTDPLTGFRKHIYISNSASETEIKDLIKKLIAIGWDEKEKSYYFTYNQKDFSKEDKNGIDKKWTIYAKALRIRREKGESGYWEYKGIDVNEQFEELFKTWEFSNPKSENLKDEIIRRDNDLKQKKPFDGKDRNFYEVFIYLFNLVLEVRNQQSLHFDLEKSEVDYGVDFFASPVKPFFTTIGRRSIAKLDEKGNIISRTDKEYFAEINFADFSKKFKCQKESVFDSDGVGAYNIARKGLLMLSKLAKNPQNRELAISKKEWDEFVIRN